MVGTISTYESEVDVVFEWKIEHFLNIPGRDGKYYRSPEFLFGGETWNLRIYPNGSSRSDSSRHVDLELVKSSCDRSIKQSFSLSLKTAEGEKYNEQLGTKDFKVWFYCHKFIQFILRSELTMRRSKLVPGNVLTVVCTMMNTTFAGSVIQLLEAKSEIDALKLNYNQALQDKAEAQTKLRVLTNNFKDKEIELQRQLSAKEADRQKKEDDFNSAKRRILLIEQENASYQSQIAGLKQEMEEKERTLKSQIPLDYLYLETELASFFQSRKNRPQETSFFQVEKMITAWASEKNLENMEEEVTQLRQRLTLLEREQENCANAEKDEIVRPVPTTCVETCTQTVEETLVYEPERAYVEACTQTLEEEFSFNNPPEDCGFVTDINHLLKENRGVDITFELETPNGKTKIFAHKLILAVMSSYFADEFYDKGRNKEHQVIPLKGINPKAFEQMIRYCYGEKPIFETTEDICALFKVAFEFKVISLQNLCHTFFRHTKIEPENVFSILKISMEMEDKSLKDMCYQILQEKTREVMTAYELCDITPAMVYTLLKLPQLSLNSAYDLIKWIFEWAKVRSEDAREYLERLLKDMNFLALTFEEFATLCKDYQGFFNSDEIASIYQNIAHAGTREMPEWFNNDLKCRVYTGSNE